MICIDRYRHVRIKAKYTVCKKQYNQVVELYEQMKICKFALKWQYEAHYHECM